MTRLMLLHATKAAILVVIGVVFQILDLQKLFTSHPPLEDRIAALGSRR